MPDNTQFAFLESSFQGQLPQPFSDYGSRPESRNFLQPFNDRNEHVPQRYSDIADCTWIIDLQNSECLPAEATILERQPFLDAVHTSTLHRVLYIPYLHEKAMAEGKVQYMDYVLAKLDNQ